MAIILQGLLVQYPCLASALQYDKKENIIRRQKVSTEYYKWASRHAHIYTNMDTAPKNMMNKNRSIEIYDFQVKCKRGPDDAVYDRHEDLRRKLARGNTVIQVCDGPQRGFYLCVYALKKFTGLSAMDDDDRADEFSLNNSASKATNLYFTKPISEASRVVSTWKANGEACHLAAISIEDEVLFLTGTKNTHIVVKNRKDIDHYANSRYNICKQFALSVFEMMESLENDLLESLTKFLCLTGWTIVFEILNNDHQHVEDLSPVKSPTLHFIAWTSTDPEFAGLTAVPPDIGIELARQFGLETINYSVVKLEEVSRHCEEIKRTNYREGNVLYYLNENGETIGLVKKKTAWYVLCRAIREKAKSLASGIQKRQRNASVSTSIHKTHQRIDTINSFLYISMQEIAHWKTLSAHFLRFVDAGMGDGSIHCDSVYNRFPVLWRRCMNEKDLDDTFKLPSSVASPDKLEKNDEVNSGGGDETH